jgi:hypothetical protein
MSATSKLIYKLKRHPAMQTPIYTKLIADAEVELTYAINRFTKFAHSEGHSDIVQICEELLGKQERSFLKRVEDGTNWVDPKFNEGFRYDDTEEELARRGCAQGGFI